MNRLLTTRQTAEILGVKTAGLEAMRTRGTGPRFIKVGRCVRYRTADLEKFIEERTRRSTSDPGPDRGRRRQAEHFRQRR